MNSNNSASLFSFNHAKAAASKEAQLAQTIISDVNVELVKAKQELKLNSDPSTEDLHRIAILNNQIKWAKEKIQECQKKIEEAEKNIKSFIFQQHGPINGRGKMVRH